MHVSSVTKDGLTPKKLARETYLLVKVQFGSDEMT